VINGDGISSTEMPLVSALVDDWTIMYFFNELAVNFFAASISILASVVVFLRISPQRLINPSYRFSVNAKQVGQLHRQQLHTGNDPDDWYKDSIALMIFDSVLVPNPEFC
jgi:hypothetical protein